MRATIRGHLLKYTVPRAIPQPQILITFRSRPDIPHAGYQRQKSPIRDFNSSSRKFQEASATERAKALNQKGLDQQEDRFRNQIDDALGEAKELQARTPWHREGSDMPPVKRMRRASAMTKG
jgi:hypothetical protein